MPADELDHTVADLAAALMANDAETVRAVTRLIVGAVDRSSAEQLAAERQEQIGRVRALLARSTG